jgi:hypothetical protein
MQATLSGVLTADMFWVISNAKPLLCSTHESMQILTPSRCTTSAFLQATLSGVLTAGMFYFISNAKPLPQLSPVRPHPSIFCAYFFASLLGQFALQLGFLVVMYRWVG